MAKFQTSSETVNLLQSSGFGRIWVENTDQFPASGAKVWDLLIKPATDAVDGLRFGEIWVESNSTATVISSSLTWYQVTVFANNGVSNGTIPDHTNDHITIDHSGTYLVDISAAVESGAGSAAIYHFRAMKNNGATALDNIHAHRAMAGGGGDTGSISLSGIVSLDATDTLEVWVENETNTTDITFVDITLSVIEIK